MSVGPIVEVAIGIIFVWIVLSLTTIQIQEWITSRLDKRARDMEAAIHEMLANPNLKSQFYDHPIIRGLTAKKRKEPSKIPPWFYRYPILRGFTKEKRKLPSYIPSQQFALAIFDIAMTAGTESSLIQQGILKLRDDLQKDAKQPIDRAIITELNLLADLARSAATTEAGTAITNKTLDLLKKEVVKFSSDHPEYEGLINGMLEETDQLKDQIKEILKKQPKNKASTLGDLRRGVAALSVISPEVNQTLNALFLNVEEYVAQGETHLAKARKNVENWFDDSMERASGVFKRYSQTMALIIGLIIALLANIDSISLTLYLWREPSVRAVLATKAQEFDLSFTSQSSNEQSDPSEAMQGFRDQFAGLNLPIGWTFKDKDDPLFITDGGACKPSPNGDNEYFGIPFYGYELSKYIPFVQNKCLTTSQPDQSTSLLLKLIGIAITAVAARQGAPFWFDFLKRFVNLRSTGANPAEREGK
jgi:hypothetical protein